MIDIEPELKAAQIEYIKRQLKMLHEMYYNELVDYSYERLCQSYEEMLHKTDLLDEQLLLHKKYYLDCLEYLFRDIDVEVPEETEFVSVYGIESDLEDDGKLPFD